MEDGEFAYLVLGIENQTGIHYAMPVRNMLYDALQYYSQVKTIAKKNRKELSLGKDEFFSGITKDDKLLLVITLVVYFGAKKWDGSKSLHEMLTNKDARALAYVEDYRIHLLEPAGMTDEDIAKLKSDLKDVFYFIKYSGDKDKLQELLENSEDFRSMKKTTAEMIKTVTNTDIDLPEGEEHVDMCLAIRQMKEESEAKGGLRMLFELVRDGLLTIAQAAVKAKLTEDQFKVEMAKAGF